MRYFLNARKIVRNIYYVYCFYSKIGISSTLVLNLANVYKKSINEYSKNFKKKTLYKKWTVIT